MSSTMTSGRSRSATVRRSHPSPTEPTTTHSIELQANRSLSEYGWSSLANAYLVAARKRAKWMKTDEGFGIVGIKDTVRGRQEYLGRIETKGLEDKGAPNQPENQSLQSRLVRGILVQLEYSHLNSMGDRYTLISRNAGSSRFSPLKKMNAGTMRKSDTGRMIANVQAIEGTAGTGIYFDGPDASGDPATATSNHTITGNVIKNCDGSAIANDKQNTDIVISGNIIENTNSVVSGAAIQLVDAENILITGNNISGTAPNAAITMAGTSDNWQITQNYLEENADVSLSGTGSVVINNAGKWGDRSDGSAP